MSRSASERLRRVVDGLGLNPGSRVLAIGCGHGAGTTVCERLDGGRWNDRRI